VEEDNIPLQIDTVNHGLTMMCEAQLKATLFREYQVQPGEINIEINKLREVKYDGRAEYDVIVDDQGLRVVGEGVERVFPNADTTQVSTFEYFKRVGYEGELKVDARYLSHAVKSLARYFDFCKISVEGETELCLYGENDNYSDMHKIKAKKYGDKELGEVKIDLKLLKGCLHGWANSVKLLLKEDCPLILEYNNTWSWSLKYAIAPVVAP